MYLPLTNNSEEIFNISIFGIIYMCRQLWNESGFWTLDIKDADGVALVYGVKMVTQEYLLSQYPQLNFDLISTVDSDPGRDSLNIFNLEVVAKNV